MVFKNPFRGKSLEQVYDVDVETFNKWNRQTLSAAVRRLSDAANKRIKRFEDKGLETPAYLNVMKSGGKFSTRGKTINQLRSEFIRVRDFLKMKTSTVRGYEKVKEDFFTRVNATTSQRISLSDDDLNRFWRIFDKTESSIIPFVKGSEQSQKMVFDVFIKNENMSEEDIIKKIYQKFDIYYEEQEELNDYVSASDFFSIEN